MHYIIILNGIVQRPVVNTTFYLIIVGRPYEFRVLNTTTFIRWMYKCTGTRKCDPMVSNVILCDVLLK